MANSTVCNVVSSNSTRERVIAVMVLGRAPYDRHTVAMLHENRMRTAHSELPTLLRYTKRDTLTRTDILFLSRMEEDVEGRRRQKFLAEVKKDPRFKPSMLQPPATTAFRMVRAREPRSSHG